jgi:hypothetical protein
MACGLCEVVVMDVDAIVCCDIGRVAIVVVATACLDTVARVAASAAAAAAAVRRKVVSIVDVKGAIAAAVEVRWCDGQGSGEQVGIGDR